MNCPAARYKTGIINMSFRNFTLAKYPESKILFPLKAYVPNY